MKKYLQYYAFDEPIPYKNLLIYPVRMKDYLLFHFCADVLMLEKNSIPDPKIISMSYLDFVYYMYKEKGESEYLPKIDWILKTVLKKEQGQEEISYYLNNKGKLIINIDGEEYNSQDFDEIIRIIAEQNDLDLPDYSIQKELRDELERARRYKQELNGTKMGTLEDQIICVLISTSLKLDDIYDLTIRKFSRILQRVDAKMHYQIYVSASLSGFVDFKDKSVLAHWMRDLEVKDKYSDVKSDPQSIHDKINKVNG